MPRTVKLDPVWLCAFVALCLYCGRWQGSIAPQVGVAACNMQHTAVCGVVHGSACLLAVPWACCLAAYIH